MFFKEKQVGTHRKWILKVVGMEGNSVPVPVLYNYGALADLCVLDCWRLCESSELRGPPVFYQLHGHYLLFCPPQTPQPALPLCQELRQKKDRKIHNVWCNPLQIPGSRDDALLNSWNSFDIVFTPVWVIVSTVSGKCISGWANLGVTEYISEWEPSKRRLHFEPRLVFSVFCFGVAFNQRYYQFVSGHVLRIKKSAYMCFLVKDLNP